VTYLASGSGGPDGAYRYDPFGRWLAQTGSYAGANGMRFSSKPWLAHNGSNTEGLYYYGYRFYDPLTQRWLNRDPLAEYLDLNLYRYSYNDSVNLVDMDGQGVPLLIAMGAGAYFAGKWLIGLYDSILNQKLAELDNESLHRLMDADPNDIDPDAMLRRRRNLVCLAARTTANYSDSPGMFNTGPPDVKFPPFTVKPSHLHADAAATLTGRPGYVRVRGFFRKNGTYVPPYYRRYPGSEMPPPDNHLYPRPDITVPEQQ
jgi:RHS repeat-associated protein